MWPARGERAGRQRIVDRTDRDHAVVRSRIVAFDSGGVAAGSYQQHTARRRVAHHFDVRTRIVGVERGLGVPKLMLMTCTPRSIRRFMPASMSASAPTPTRVSPCNAAPSTRTGVSPHRRRRRRVAARGRWHAGCRRRPSRGQPRRRDPRPVRHCRRSGRVAQRRGVEVDGVEAGAAAGQARHAARRRCRPARRSPRDRRAASQAPPAGHPAGARRRERWHARRRSGPRTASRTPGRARRARLSAPAPATTAALRASSATSMRSTRATPLSCSTSSKRRAPGTPGRCGARRVRCAAAWRAPHRRDARAGGRSARRRCAWPWRRLRAASRRLGK